jgi:hypothetical protein
VRGGGTCNENPLQQPHLSKPSMQSRCALCGLAQALPCRNVCGKVLAVQCTVSALHPRNRDAGPCDLHHPALQECAWQGAYVVIGLSLPPSEPFVAHSSVDHSFWTPPAPTPCLMPAKFTAGACVAKCLLPS